MCWDGETNHEHSSVAPRLASCFEAAIIHQHAPGGIPVSSLCLLLCPLLRDHRPHCLFSSLPVFPPRQFKQMCARLPQNWKQSWKEPSGSRLEDGQAPPWSLETADGSQVTNIRPSLIHKAGEVTDMTPGCLQISSIHSFAYSVTHSANIVWHSKLFRPIKSLRVHSEQDM